jgi:vitamin B12/bleomycin/antimicrobial peptide transport system ATP-binding/permease protein
MASSRIIDRDSARDWRAVLSAEEQQLVARLLLAAPRFAILGPLAASLGVGQATRVLAALAERGVGYVVLGDRALVDAVVDGADGTWTQTPMEEETR